MLRIIIKNNDSNTNIKITIPMSIVIAGLRIIKPFIKEDHINRYYKTDNKDMSKGSKDIKLMVNELIKGLKYLKKNHKGLVLVDIESEQDIVKIQI